jgi:hypothetical protein
VSTPRTTFITAVMGITVVAGGTESRQSTGATSIVVTRAAVISTDAASINHAEPWLAVDPQNPARAIAVALVDGGNQSVVYSTADGGVTWRRGSHAGAGSQRFVGGDPLTVFDGDGTALFATISPFRVWRSRDGGVSWQGPATVPGRSYDREYLAVRPVPNARDTVYALAKTPIHVFGHLASDALALAQSGDGGETFEAPRLFLPDPTRSIIHVPGGLVVAPNGDLLIPFLAHDAPPTDLAVLKNHIWVIRSTDGGRVFGEPVAAAASVVYGNRGDEIKMLKSLAVARLVMDTARASAFRGRLYLAYLTALDGRLQVMVTTSRDTGRTWGPPAKVNDDTGSANHSNPQIAVNDRGAVAVTWNDRRVDPNDLCFRATVSASLDGGMSFLPSIPLEEEATCPLGPNPARPLKLDSFVGRYVQGGETQGLAALPAGKFLAVFIGGGRTMQLHSATIEVVGDRDRR